MFGGFGEKILIKLLPYFSILRAGDLSATVSSQPFYTFHMFVSEETFQRSFILLPQNCFPFLLSHTFLTFCVLSEFQHMSVSGLGHRDSYF